MSKLLIKPDKFYPKPSWAVSQSVRRNNLRFIIEDICPCGLAHPNKEWIKEIDPENLNYYGIHYCCGCCSEETIDELPF